MALTIRCTRDGEQYSPDEIAYLSNGAPVAKKNLKEGEEGFESENEVTRDEATPPADEDTAPEPKEEVEEGSESDDEEEDTDKYDTMEYKELQAEAKGRENVKGNLPEDELREALRADDASEE